ncbi:conjugated polyketone reductase C1 [Pholiota conissans]|uniref:Conjugated polyketone reductase C1 n=1 Tax=Pholiota conissans TaxID=109636 RepID=A0A9P5YYS3_9AGAR|nr:conjugated polyketone reductase C1 [Pholiota conissans]
MTIQPVHSFTLLDGTTIPWIAWGNGSGNAQKTAVISGKLALESGLRHIDTAQIYRNEKETGEAIKQSSVPREDVYVTSKLSTRPDGAPVPFDEITASIQDSLDKLGFVPNLYLIHNPFVVEGGKLKAAWKVLEDLKDQGKLQSIGVSNFRPQDLEEILDGAKYKPVVNQIEYHPYVLTHLEPLLALQKKHGILTESYGPSRPSSDTPPAAARSNPISQVVGKKLDPTVVLLLWTRAQGVVVVTASGNPAHIKELGVIATLPEGLVTEEEVREIERVGRGVHFRYYTEHMEKDFPLPDLPSQ